ncbi:MAG TPA: transposase, partial [Thermoanaerobaculia bacterium]
VFRHGAYVSQGTLARTTRTARRFFALLKHSADRFAVTLQAWVILANHYHLMAIAPANTLSKFIEYLHSRSSHELNALDNARGRKSWFQYRETFITHQSSYLARVNYIHQNPVHHRVVATAENYKWSSHAWFRDTKPALAKAVGQFKIDRLNIEDDF